MTLLWIAGTFLGLFVVVKIIASLSDAKLRRSGVLPAPGQATMADVDRLVRSGQRILAIRCYREIHHVGLAEAKKAIDDLHVAA